MKSNIALKTKPKNTRVQIGEVGVDSGQLMVCDPCYIDGEWKKESYNPNRKPRWRDSAGHVWGSSLHGKHDGGVMLFRAFDEKLQAGGTPNELIASGAWKEMAKPEPSGVFSYNGCCEATVSDARAGQLKYELGHAGAGVAFSSGYGDGCYPVFATFNEDGRIVKVEIIMGNQYD